VPSAVGSGNNPKHRVFQNLRLPFNVTAFTGEAGSKDFRVWLDDFKRMARSQGMTEDECLDCLPSFLDGMALFVYKRQISDFEKLTFDSLVVAIDKNIRGMLGNGSETLHAMLQKRDQTVAEFATQLWNRAESVYASMAKEELEELCKNIFLAGVKTEIKNEFGLGDTGSLNDTVRQAVKAESKIQQFGSKTRFSAGGEAQEKAVAWAREAKGALAVKKLLGR